MESQGIFISGVFVGFDQVSRTYEQKEVINYIYLIVVGADCFRVQSQNDYSASIAFGDLVTFKVRTRAYNNVVYYNGDYVE